MSLEDPHQNDSSFLCNFAQKTVSHLWLMLHSRAWGVTAEATRGGKQRQPVGRSMPLLQSRISLLLTRQANKWRDEVQGR